MNCTEFLAKLTDYFDGQIDPDLLAEVKQHLCTCHHCEVVVDTTRKTIDIYRGHEPYDLPGRTLHPPALRHHGTLQSMRQTQKPLPLSKPKAHS